MSELMPAPPQAPTGRIASIDVLRGLTILVMIFVNDVAGVKGTPAWMKHYFPYDADGMTFVDVVFPAFLFIVGMSIPFAIGGRLERGEPLGRIGKHVFVRTFGLLVIGVFMVNSYSISKAGALHPDLWCVLMYFGVILVWNTPPRDPGRGRNLALIGRVGGILLLCLMALAYRGPGEPGLVELRTHWWGILGLIGWAYLVACVIYIPLRKNPVAIVGGVAILYCLYMADHTGMFSGLWIRQYVDFGSMIGSQAAITVSGLLLGMILTPDSAVKSPGARIRWAILYGVALWIAGRLLYSLHTLDKMWIVNKNAATPPWCLYCSALTAWVWALIYWLVDVKGWRKWAVILQPGGENPLFAYILEPMAYSVFGLLAIGLGGFNFYEKMGESFSVGFCRSVVFAIGITWLAGALKKAGLRLRL